MEAGFGLRKIDDLTKPEWDLKGPLPRLSIVVPARNEQDTIEPALASLLNLDYGNYEVIVVNDRSTDRTGEILSRLESASHGRLRVVHVSELPAGWLGKPHAMWQGAQQAGGDWLLFTDADVVFRPDALRRSVAYAEAEHADHLALFPEMEMHSAGERMMLALFAMYIILRFRPWKAADAASREYLGGGVFNMIRKAVYERIGTFKALRMEVVEDMKLGKLVKSNGFTQRCALAPGLIKIRWVVGAFGFVHGITKNFFAWIEFQLWRVLTSVLSMAFFMLLPYVGIILAPGWSKAGFALALSAICCVYLALSFQSSISPLYMLTHPLGSILLIYAMLRSVCVTLWNGGITWRDTKYSLEELRKGLV
jgi:hypothetical protein